MEETSFVAQLEQRTQQVKITLANLEAEKTRIEGLISQLSPLVPQYDSLLAAERSIAQANIPIEVGRQAEAAAETPAATSFGWAQRETAPPAESAAREASSWG